MISEHVYLSIQYKICTYCIVTYFSIMTEANIHGLGVPTNDIAPIQHTHANQYHQIDVGNLNLDIDDEEEEEDNIDNTGHTSYGHTTREDITNDSIGSISSMSTGLLAFASPIASPIASPNASPIASPNVSISSNGGRRSKTRRKSRAKRGNKTTKRRRRTKRKRTGRNNKNKKRVYFSRNPTKKNNTPMRIVKK